MFWFYGIAGHGRGLVDAMSSFGAKSPIHSSIITTDNMFNTASEIKDFLDKEFEDDATKSYYLIDENDNAVPRRVPKEERPQIVINGSSKLRLAAVNPLGEWMLKEEVDTSMDGVMNLVVQEHELELKYGEESDEESDGISFPRSQDHFEKFNKLIEWELEDEMAAVEERLKKWGREKLVENGITLFDLEGRNDGWLFGQRIVKLFTRGEALPHHRFRHEQKRKS